MLERAQIIWRRQGELPRDAEAHSGELHDQPVGQSRRLPLERRRLTGGKYMEQGYVPRLYSGQYSVHALVLHSVQLVPYRREHDTQVLVRLLQ